MTTEEKEVALDQPFGPSENSAEEPKDEPETKGKEEKVAEVPAEEPARIPYSRFENVNRARREAEAEAEKWRVRAQELEQSRQQPVQQTNDEELARWIRTYGDNDQAKEAFRIQKESEARILAQAEEKAFKRLQESQQQEQIAYRDNLKTLDENLEMISDIAGHPLTEDEQSKVLEIIDEYTAKDEDGNYAGAILPPDKAWELYQLKEQVAKAPSRKSRDNVASVISTPTSGQPTLEQQERDKNWRPWDDSRYPK